MPELPEVETVRRLIRPQLEGRTIEDAEVRWARTVGGHAQRFRRAVRGARVGAIERRGKFLVARLERGEPAGREAGGALVVHLRMTGRLHVEAPEVDPGPWARLSLALDDGRRLHFVDVRKFGRFLFHERPQELLAHLGPEPLGAAFDPAWLRAALRARRRALKPLLLDQSFLAGLGNIYVDEALHRARLHPLQRSDRVSAAKASALHGAIRAVLEAAIEREGSSFDAFYRTPEGRPGSYQHQFQVYGRDGRPCLRCGATVVKIVVGQRGTHLCPRCQRAPRRAG